MNTCSNCGVAVRPGAKFCTSCGTRLNDVSASAASSEWTSGQPARDEESVPGTSGVSGAMSETGVSTASDGTRVDLPTVDASESPDAASSPSTSEEASSSWSWRSSPSDIDTPTSAPNDAEDQPAAALTSEESRVFTPEKRDAELAPSPEADASSDEFTWTWGSSDSPDSASDDEADTSSTVSEQGAASVEDTPLATEPDAISDANTVGGANDGQDSSASPHEQFWAAGSGSGDTSNPSPAASGDADLAMEADTVHAQQPPFAEEDDPDPSAAPGEPALASTEEDPLDRARRLVDELRTLIPPPRLYQEDAPQALGATASASVPEGLQGDLESARSSTDFGELRSALESARERPRDVDTMLELVGRIDTMLEALDDRDRLASAVDRAIGQLGAGSSGSGQ